MSEPSIWCAAFLLAPYLADDKHGSKSEAGRDDEPSRDHVPAASKRLMVSVALSGRSTSYTAIPIWNISSCPLEYHYSNTYTGVPNYNNFANEMRAASVLFAAG